MKIVVTGGAGFIGSAVVRFLLAEPGVSVVTVDKLTYAGDLESIESARGHPDHSFERVDICDMPAMREVMARHRPDAVFHLAAESHVDRSIDGPSAFIETNLVGTYSLLEVCLDYWRTLDAAARDAFRFLHVSTDEVFGSLGMEGRFDAASPYRPSSPYAATKAGADHLARAWQQSFGLPVIVSNCTNNYGPFQHPEKLIPVVILAALEGRPIPVYGKGANVRDWIFVDDHVRALWRILGRGRVGETYLVGGGEERANLDLVRTICAILDELRPLAHGGARERLITFVKDRPGHDLRYAVDDRGTRKQLGWAPEETLASGLRRTVMWYLDHEEWWRRRLAGRQAGHRLGLARSESEGGRVHAG